MTQNKVNMCHLCSFKSLKVQYILLSSNSAQPFLFDLCKGKQVLANWCSAENFK